MLGNFPFQLYGAKSALVAIALPLTSTATVYVGN